METVCSEQSSTVCQTSALCLVWENTIYIEQVNIWDFSFLFFFADIQNWIQWISEKHKGNKTIQACVIVGETVEIMRSS